MTYNALNFDSSSGNRADYFKAIVENANPDIIVMQEIVDNSGANILLDTFNEINNEYSASVFVNGCDTDDMLYFKNDIVDWSSQSTISTNLRDISEYVVSINDNVLMIYSCHLKASIGYEEERLQDILDLRDHLENLNSGIEYLIVGDMNFYTNTELAY